jgi:ABC-type branched-subunit amino acid transport system substrate-binding protein
MKVGLLHPKSGVGGLWATSLEAAAMVGAAEINAEGGIGGEAIELVAGDCGFSTTEALAAVDMLIEQEGVDAIIGGHASNVRDAVSQRIARRVPYIYTAQFEGGPTGPSTAAIGTVDGDLLAPAIAWFKHEKRAERFFFVGNNYVWPKVAARTTRQILRREGLTLVGERLVSVGSVDYGPLLRQIRDSRAQVVITALIGFSSVEFNRAFAASGLDREVLRFGLIVDETIVCNIGAESSGNLYTAANYFSTQRTRFNDRFRELYHDAFGEYAPPISSVSIGYYEGIRALAGFVDDAGPGSGRYLADQLDRVGAPRLREHTPGGARRSIYLGAADGVTLQVIAQLTH